MKSIQALIARRPYMISLILAVLLLVLNIIALPQSNLAYWPGLVSNIAPFALVAIASTPAVLGGGIDLSIGPLMVLVNIVIVMVLIPSGLTSPWVVLPIALIIGGFVGTVNGVLVALLRFPAIIATLCVMFVLIGIDLRLAPQPGGGSIPWLETLTSRVGLFPIAALVLVVPFIIWGVLRRSAYIKNLLASGGDPIAAFSAGVPVQTVRVLSYTLGGIFAAIGGVMLTSLLRSADATQAPMMTLIALAAVALGGTVFTGGRGGILGSLFGAICIFLIQSLLTAIQVSAVWINVIYGALLVGAIILGALVLVRKNVRTAV